MSSTERERAGLRSQLEITERRLAILERQSQYYGQRADPAVTMEIADLRLKAAELREKLEPPRQIPIDIWEHMSADDQRRYLIKLVMELQADFVGCRMKLNADVKRWIAALVVAVVVTQVVSLTLSTLLPKLLGG